LGDGNTSDRGTPGDVVEGLSFISIAAGKEQTCAVTGLGDAFCWGAGAGVGSVPGPTPQQVGPGMTFTEITAGYSHTCALSSVGTVYCWGNNGSGQFGNGTTQDSYVPTLGAGGQTFVSIAAGGISTCGLEGDGTACCWGRNADGQLGIGTMIDAHSPEPVIGGHHFSYLDISDRHACGVTTDNKLYCWGSDDSGRLGTDGTTETCGGEPCTSTPLMVEEIPDVALVSVPPSFGYHTCAVTVDGAAYCWGRNNVGSVGDGTTQNRFVPVQVLDPQ